MRLPVFLAPLLFLNPGLCPAAEKAAFVASLEAGKPQVIVTYGTSLTAGGDWVAQFGAALERKFPKLATIVNSAQGGMWSKWGVDNLEARVIAKKPDVVFIEFSINDAFLEYKTPVEDARKNLETMIDRTLAALPGCEIILMVMNPPTGEHLERRPKIADYEQVYRDVARARGLRLIDHSANWQAVLKSGDAAWKALVPDGIHPNAAGAQQVILPHLLQGIGLQP
jgi:acyl-CoA thioesterase-1